MISGPMVGWKYRVYQILSGLSKHRIELDVVKESSDQLFLTGVLLQCFQRMTKCVVNGVGIIPVVSDKTEVLGPMHFEDFFSNYL